MIVRFKINKKNYQGRVISRGYVNVDKPEVYEIQYSEKIYQTIEIPVSRCEIVTA